MDPGKTTKVQGQPGLQCQATQGYILRNWLKPSPQPHLHKKKKKTPSFSRIEARWHGSTWPLAQHLGGLVAGGSRIEGQLDYNVRLVSNRKFAKAKKRECLCTGRAHHAGHNDWKHAKGNCSAAQLQGSRVRAAISKKNPNNYNISTTRPDLQNPEKNSASLQIDGPAKCLINYGSEYEKSSFRMPKSQIFPMHYQKV